MTVEDLSGLSMHDLFRVEARSQTQVLTSGLLALERDPTASDHLEACMRAAHSLKGGARIVDIDAGVALAHAMEDVFVAAQQGRTTLNREQVDLLLQGVDLMMAITSAPTLQTDPAIGQNRQNIDAFIAKLERILARSGSPDQLQAPATPPPDAPTPRDSMEAHSAVSSTSSEPEASDRVLRVTVGNLNRLLGLAAESLVESRWLKPFGQSLLRLKRLQHESAKAIDGLCGALPQEALDERARVAMADTQRLILKCQQFLSDRLAELEESDRQFTSLSHRLYDQALACRMRPFSDGVQRFPRVVRDLARSLGKEARLDIIGTATQVDRDMLEMLDAPLAHLLRNAIDHGIEAPDERRAAGKPPEGVVCLEAHHSAGSLQIVVSDDGRGIDLARVRETVLKRRLANVETVETLSENELLQFLFLPGFTMKEEVTEISGRGVGLDVVQDMVSKVRGVVRISSQEGSGTRFHLQLPLTLSIVRTLLVEIGGEPYAFPLAYIMRALKLSVQGIEILEGRQHFDFDGQSVGLVAAHQILSCGEAGFDGKELSVVVVGDQHDRYGLVVDRFLGEKELVVQPLDPRLGKINDISAAALMENGSPVLIVDVEDMIRSVEKLAQTERLNKVQREVPNDGEQRRKRILVIDDSLTVRELQRKLLDRNGYEIEVAVDGMDGWNAVRAGHFDLIITDVDMPRMDGIELVKLIRKHAQLRSLPVMIVSYKEREEDRRRGLEAGADYYLTKGSFHDDTLLQAVMDLIGEAST